MARSTFDVVEEYTGNGAQSAYTFDFKIESKDQLLIIEHDNSGVETQRVRGTDVTYLSSVTFDANDGGGTVNLAANLTNNYKLFILLADDTPTQTSEFKNQGSFTLAKMEAALDIVAGPVQRLAYLMARALRLDDTVDTADFDPKLPLTLVGSADVAIVTNAAGDGLAVGPTTDEISNAQTYATNAAASATAASAAQTAAETAQAAAEAAAGSITAWPEYAVTNGQAAAALDNGTDSETIDISTESSKYWNIEIIRGTTVVSNGTVAIQNVNGTPRVVTGSFMNKEAHGVTFSVANVSGTVYALRAALDSGAGDGTIKANARGIPA